MKSKHVFFRELGHVRKARLYDVTNCVPTILVNCTQFDPTLFFLKEKEVANLNPSLRVFPNRFKKVLKTL
ncbi:hypothetical protein AUJ65_01575 [Candidatus Micrarchaeota archaeon CG1_02_51_15]|nr:MAG: hypothetical protein AUJ65_01575 [Candidatus Micrarchaeota archaeon CG1_02_51_15]